MNKEINMRSNYLNFKHVYLLVSLIILSSCNTARLTGSYKRTMDVHLFKPMYSSGIQFFKDSTFLFEYGAYMNEPTTKGTYRYIGEKKFVLNSDYNNTLIFQVAKEKVDTAVSIVRVNFTSDLPLEMFKEFYTIINDTLRGYDVPEKEFFLTGGLNKIKFNMRLKDQIIGTKNTLFTNDTIQINKTKLNFKEDSRSFTSFEFSKINSINRVKSLFRR